MPAAFLTPKLHLQSCAHTKEAWSLLKDFDSRQDHWVVSDLKTKLEIQSQLLDQNKGLLGEPVLRATELWERALRQRDPGIRVVSSAAFRWMAEVLMEAEKHPLLAERPRLRGMALDLMEELYPVFEHPEAESILNEFFQEFPMTAKRWEPLIAEVRRVREVLLEQGILPRSLLPQALLDRDIDFEKTFPGRWFFDLGPSMTPAEAELLKRISNVAEVTVMVPTPRWASEWASVLRPFESFGVKLNWRDVEEPHSREVRRFTGRAAEVKDAVAQVRQWLESGVNPDHIAIFSTTLEEDLPALHAHLSAEGIPCGGGISQGKLHSLPQVQEGLARLRLSTQEPQFADLFTVARKASSASSEKLQALFKNAVTRSDLDRDALMAQRIQAWSPETPSMKFEEFLDWGGRVWPSVSRSHWELLIEQMSQEIPLEWTAAPGPWVRWIETLAAKVELRHEGSPGVHLVSHRTHESGRWTHVYFLNAKASEPQPGLLSMKEWSFFHHRFGFLLPHPELSLDEFSFYWSLYQPREHLIVGLPMADWSGAAQTLDAGVLAWAGESKVRAPQETRWDQQVQLQSQEASLQEENLAEAGAGEAAVPARLPFKELPRLSISSIEKFRKCPFQYTAQKRFGFNDESEADLSLDERQKGTVLHRAVELMFDPIRSFRGSDSDFEQLLEELKSEVSDLYVWPALWPSLRARLSRQLKRVWFELQAELSDLPQRKILGVEVGFECYFNPATKSWSRQPSPGAIFFRGKIDRVDGLRDGSRLLIDYKSSLGSIKASPKWLEENTLQMGLYSWLVEEGLVNPEVQGSVLGAEYMSLRDPEDRRGIHREEGVGSLFSAALIDGPVAKEDFHQTLQAIREAVEESSQELIEGRYLPAPRKKEICDSCSRRDLCRWNPS